MLSGIPDITPVQQPLLQKKILRAKTNTPPPYIVFVGFTHPLLLFAFDFFSRLAFRIKGNNWDMGSLLRGAKTSKIH